MCDWGISTRDRALPRGSGGGAAVAALALLAGCAEAALSLPEFPVVLPPEQSAEYLLGYGPESGRSQLRVRVPALKLGASSMSALTPVEGESRYRHEQLSDNAPEGTVCADGVLEVPVSVSLQSQTQALAETFAARLEARSAYRAQLSHRFAPGSWSGGFAFTEVVSLDPQRVVSMGPLSLSVVLWEGGSMGSLATEIVSQPKPSANSKPAAGAEAWPTALASSEPTSLALWPSAEPCTDPSVAPTGHQAWRGTGVTLPYRTSDSVGSL